MPAADSPARPNRGIQRKRRTQPNRRMPPNRRMQRSVRAGVAVLLLAFGAVVVVAALLHGAFLSLSTAAVVAWAVGAGATRIMHNELQQSRRQHARERADQAQAYAQLAARRARQNAAFAAAMRQQVADHATTIERLRATVRLAEKRAELAEQAGQRTRVMLARAQQEVRDLRLRIGELEAEHDGMLEALANARAEAERSAADTPSNAGVAG